MLPSLVTAERFIPSQSCSAVYVQKQSLSYQQKLQNWRTWYSWFCLRSISTSCRKAPILLRFCTGLFLIFLALAAYLYTKPAFSSPQFTCLLKLSAYRVENAQRLLTRPETPAQHSCPSWLGFSNNVMHRVLALQSVVQQFGVSSPACSPVTSQLCACNT